MAKARLPVGRCVHCPWVGIVARLRSSSSPNSPPHPFPPCFYDFILKFPCCNTSSRDEQTLGGHGGHDKGAPTPHHHPVTCQLAGIPPTHRLNTIPSRLQSVARIIPQKQQMEATRPSKTRRASFKLLSNLQADAPRDAGFTSATPLPSVVKQNYARDSRQTDTRRVSNNGMPQTECPSDRTKLIETSREPSRHARLSVRSASVSASDSLQLHQVRQGTGPPLRNQDDEFRSHHPVHYYQAWKAVLPSTTSMASVQCLTRLHKIETGCSLP